jgi:hypothetical protein
MSSLFTNPKVSFPVTLGHQRRVRPLPPASPASKFCPLRESVRARPELPQAKRPFALLTFRPSRDLVSQALDPRTHPEPRDPSTRHDARRWGTRPQRRVRPPQATTNSKLLATTGSFSSAVPGPLQDRTAPPLGGTPSFPWPSAPKRKRKRTVNDRSPRRS